MSHLELCIPPSTILCKLISVALCIWAWTTGYLGNSDGDTDVDRVTFWFSFTCLCRVCHPLAEPPACNCPSLLSPATWPHSLYRTSVTNRKQHAQWGRGSRDKRSLSLLIHTAHRQGYSLTKTKIDWDGIRIQLSLQASLSSISNDK